MMSLKKRYLRPEIMDDPFLDPLLHDQALRELERLNLWSFGARSILNGLKRDFLPHQSSLRILDIATGGGDVPARLARLAAQENLPIEIHGCDKSPHAVAFAQKRTENQKQKIHFFELDILNEKIPKNYDVILSSLFLHHLPVRKTFSFLKACASAAKQGILINDLTRSWTGFAAAYTACRFGTSSRVVHEDGPQSVRAAYRIPEIQRLAERAGLKNAKVSKIWPFRYQLVWRKS